MKTININHQKESIEKVVKLRKPNKDSTSLSVTIPAAIVKELCLTDKDKIRFKTERDNNNNSKYDIEFIKN